MPTVSPDIELADAIVADLNAQTFSIGFEAERTWLPQWDQLKELADLAVIVQPSPTPQAAPFERKNLQETWPIDIGFARRLRNKDRDEVDALVGLVDEVCEYIVPLDDTPGFYEITDSTMQCNGWEFLTRFDPNQLSREKLPDNSINYVGNFLSVIRFNFLRLH